MLNEEYYSLFDQYLANELTAEAKINFEKELAADSNLASAFTTFQEINSHLKFKFENLAKEAAFKENLTEISKEHFQATKQEKKVINFKPWRYVAAASVVLLSGWFLFQNSNPSFEDYNYPEKAYFTERSSPEANEKQAENYFNAQKYKEAIPYFEAVLKQKKSPEMQYYCAISLLENNEIIKAESNLNELKSGNSIYKNKAIWFLALSKLKQKQYDSCKAILETIPQDFEDYEKVESLLRELD